MHLTIESLIQHANDLQKQFEAAANMTQQTAGALAFVRTEINKLLQAKADAELAAQKEAQEQQENEENGQVNNEATQQPA